MPDQVILYRCSICKRGPITYSEALQCELLGEPKFRYKIGEKFYGKVFLDEVKRHWTIVDRRIEFRSVDHDHIRSHEPAYKIVSHGKERWVPEEQIRELMPK